MFSFKVLILLLFFVKIDSNVSELENSENVLPEKCPNKALNSLFEILTPEDYEEGKVSDIYKRVKNFNETLNKFERLQILSKNVSTKLENVVNRLSSRMMEVLMQVDLPSECLTALAKIASGIQSKQPWALKFIETTPSHQSGLGLPAIAYDECLDTEIPNNELNSNEKIKSQYCWAEFSNIIPEEYTEEITEFFNDTVMNQINAHLNKSGTFNSTSRFKNARFERTSFYETIVINKWRKSFINKLPIGLCLPQTCKAKSIEYALNKVLYPITRVPFAINRDCDYVGKPLTLNIYQWVSINIYAVLIFLVLISTFYDIFINLLENQNKRPNNSLVSRLGQTFSAFHNLRTLFLGNRPKKNLRFLDGIRAILAFVILLCHEHELALIIFPMRGLGFTSRLFHDRSYMHIKNLNVVETFFFLGGMMTCYVMLSKLEQTKGKFNYFHYAVYRYLRIIPTTMGPVLLVFIYPLLGNGPYWEMTSNILYLPCRDNWLPSFTMTSNFDIHMPEKFICNVGNWSISTDYQLYLLSPIIILVLYYSPKVGVVWNLILMIVAIFIGLAPKIIWNIPHFFEFPPVESIWTYINLLIPYYWRIDTHVISYVMGIFCGYLIRQKPDLYFGGRIGELFLWITTSLLMFWSIWWSSDIMNPYYEMAKHEIVWYLAFSKPLYLSFWFWLAYACATGRAGFVNRFFSWKGFKLFGVLSFEICVLHPMVFLYRVGTNRGPVIFSAYYVWTNSFFDFLVTFLVALVFYIIVSAPCSNLVQMLMQNSRQISTKKVQMNGNNKSD